MGQIKTISKNYLCENIVTKIYIFEKIQSNDSCFNLGALMMHVGGLYFINQETIDYFPESGWLLNLSLNTLKEQKTHDTHEWCTLNSRTIYKKTVVVNALKWGFKLGWLLCSSLTGMWIVIFLCCVKTRKSQFFDGKYL